MIPVSKPYIDNSDITAVTNQIKSGWISSNAKIISSFEKKISDFIGCDASCALAVSNGTTAIELALRSFKLHNSKKVIVPDITFAATINAIISVGLTPLILPVDENLCYEEKYFSEVVEKEDISGIIFVHLYGTECITPLQYEFIDKNRKILTIADCAESFDAFKNNRHIGLKCDAFTFSFFANKVITTGEGGFVGFKSNKFADRAKLIRDHGMSKDHKYWHLEFGTNTRMTALQAALGISQLEKIEFFNNERRKILKTYQDCLDNSKYFMIWSANNCLSVWFVNLTLKEDYNNDSKLFYLSEFLKENNIETRPCFHNLSDMPLYNKFSHNILKKDHNELENIPSKYLKLISLPTYIGLYKKEICEICNLILKFESSL